MEAIPILRGGYGVLDLHGITTVGEERGMYRVFVGKPERKRPLERPRCRWQDNIRMDLQEVGCGGWTGLGWLRIEIGGEQL
jgi:hypothetical protein